MNYIEHVTRDISGYCPPFTKQPDFDAFWEGNLSLSRVKPANLTVEKAAYPCPYIHLYHVQYDGFDDTKVSGWYFTPAFLPQENLPVIINFHGYNGRDNPVMDLHWALMGCAVFSPDARGQNDQSPDQHVYRSCSMTNHTSQGMLDKEDYYLRYLFMDNVRAIDAVLQRPEIDKEKIILKGGSQGGGVALAVAALDHRPIAALPTVPAYCDLVQNLSQGVGGMLALHKYFINYPDNVDRVVEVLSYFDNMNLAPRIRCPVFIGAGLLDASVPAKSVYAAYNRIEAPKDIRVYPFSGHQLGPWHQERQMEFVRKLLAAN
jgi:cephalosporin-C deacetylase